MVVSSSTSPARPAFSRDQVKEYLAAVALADSARKALGEAGLADDVDVSMTGIDAPREARLVIAAEPAEVADYRALAERIRSALRDFHITLACSQGEDAEATEALVNELLLDGEPVRLTKLKPRT
ncbi:hypothetical protein AB0N09_27810 [Streptomyces erythrochromogenes]|uniref:hypothetical protein n=1 Tax=Streptomyces erythrochromogenes TaxID=285574 RepID=UPI00341CEF6E